MQRSSYAIALAPPLFFVFLATLKASPHTMKGIPVDPPAWRFAQTWRVTVRRARSRPRGPDREII
jgi:hypothetical protein